MGCGVYCKQGGVSESHMQAKTNAFKHDAYTVATFISCLTDFTPVAAGLHGSQCLIFSPSVIGYSWIQ